MAQNRDFYLLHLHSTPTPPPVGGPRRNIAFAMPFGTDKLEWLGYQTVKDFDNTIIRFDRIHERDRQIYGHRMTA